MKKDQTKLIGRNFGLLTVIAYHGRKKNRYYWDVMCSCENKTVKAVREDALLGGQTKSCGCNASNKNGPIKSELPQKNLIGRIFGRLEVKEFAFWENNGNRRRPIWLCQCSCSERKLIAVRGDSLTNENTKSCGCLKMENKSGGRKSQEKPLEDLTGRSFGRLTVLGFGYKDGRRFFWECYCDCGTVDFFRQDKLKEGHTKSCGCLSKENTGPTAKKDREVKVINDHFGKYKRLDNFDIEYARFVIIVKKSCIYCGNFDTKHDNYTGMQFKINGIDRVDNKVGYILENIVPCCQICNYMKRDLLLEKFVDWIITINHGHNLTNKSIDYVSILRSPSLTKITLETHLKKFVRQTKQDAHNKGRKFLLSEEQVRNLILSPCKYCGLFNGLTKDNYWVNGIDRMENSEGYIIENSVPCCTICNKAKLDMSVASFISHVQRMLPFAEDFRKRGSLYF